MSIRVSLLYLHKKYMYPKEIYEPMKFELTELGFEDLVTPSEVEEALKKSGTTLVVVNSVCGCAAANARPAVRISLSNKVKPTNLVTVFAGVDGEATELVRSHMVPFPPSSPSIGLFKDGELIHMIERHHIEGRPANVIADNLISAFNEHC